MQFRTHGAIAVLTALLFTAGCTSPSDTRKSDTCADKPQLTACAPASASPTLPDVKVRDLSLRKVAETARDTLGVSMSLRVVLAGNKLNCTMSGSDYEVTGDETGFAPYCDEGYLAVSAKLSEHWATTPTAAIWYEVASQVARSDQHYRAHMLDAACVAAFVSTQLQGYNGAIHDKQILARAKTLHGDDGGMSFARKGLGIARAGKSVNACKS